MLEEEAKSLVVEMVEGDGSEKEDEGFKDLGVWKDDEKDRLFEFEDVGWIASVLFLDLHIRKMENEMTIFSLGEILAGFKVW